MSPNFKKYFSKKESVPKKIPDSIIQELSNRLPRNLKYEQVQDGVLTIQPVNEEMQIKIPKPSEEDEVFKEYLPKNSYEFADFLYRTQRSYIYTGDMDNTFTIAGNSFKLEDVIKKPFEKGKFENLTLRIVPPKFPSPFPLELQFGDIKKEFLVKRIPNPSMQELHFESNSVPYFDINYVLHEDTNTLSFSFKAHLDKTKTISEHIECYKMYKACMNKDLKLKDHPLTEGSIKSDINAENIEKVLNFWEKVKEIEDYLNVEFKPSQDIMMNDASLVEELYRSFIKNKPTKSFITMEELNVSGPKNGFDVNSLIGLAGLSVSFHQTENVTLFEEHLKLNCQIYFFNLYVKDAKKDEGDDMYKLYVEPIEGERIYQSRLYVSSYENISVTQDEFENADVLNMES